MHARYLPGTILGFVCVASAVAQPITTAFTYQGDLTSAGTPASGLHDLRFRLYTALSGGTQVGTTQCADNVAVTGGRFTVSLDFGAQFAGQQRFLEIEVRADTGLACSNAAGFVVLSPRQPLTAAPNALFALNTTQFNGQAATFYQNAANLSSGTIPSGRLTGPYTGVLTLSNAGNAFAGSGAGLTALNATNLASGTLADARLSSNVALLNAAQTFSSVKTFGAGLRVPTGAQNGFVLTSDVTGVAAWHPPLSLPYSGSVSSTQAAFAIANTSAVGTAADALWAQTDSGDMNAAGVRGVNSSTGHGVGVYGDATNGLIGTGVVGYGSATGGFFRSLGAASQQNIGAFGVSAGDPGDPAWGVVGSSNQWGVQGQSAGERGVGVVGLETATTGTTVGVLGETWSDTSHAAGVRGSAATTGGGSVIGVEGVATSGTLGTGLAGYGSATGLFAVGYAINANPVGVIGQSPSASGRGVVGYAGASSGVTYGVAGEAGSPSGWAVFATGRIGASIKAFRIDHPDDPANKYLLHYTTESPEVMNFYSETVTLDDLGEAVVELPPYFAKINRRPRYQLTAVGAPMPMLHVAGKISEEALAAGAAMEPDQAAPLCTFRIAGGAPGGEVSWRVEAVRNDRWVQRYGAPVEEEKQGREKGAYQHPELYDQPAEKGMNYDVMHRGPEPEQAEPVAAASPR